MKFFFFFFVFASSFCFFLLPRVSSEHASLPPRGWNSYDSFCWTISEQEFLESAKIISERLLPHGYQYVVLDYLWYRRKVPGAYVDSLGFDVIDKWGRMIPDPARWPSSKGGIGLHRVARRVHKMGLKFGIHVMSGISTQAVNANTPILDVTTGRAYEENGRIWRAKDIGIKERACAWMRNGFMSVDTKSGAGRSFLKSLYTQYAAWGVDFVKHDCVFGDDLDLNEISYVSEVLKQLDRAIVYSLSPGTSVTPSMAKSVSKLVNMYRVTGDDWDTWGDVAAHFDVSRNFASAKMVGSEGLLGRSWPDLDMLPLGWLTDPGLRSTVATARGRKTATQGGRQQSSTAREEGRSRPVTRSQSRARNNLVSEPTGKDGSMSSDGASLREKSPDKSESPGRGATQEEVQRALAHQKAVTTDGINAAEERIMGKVSSLISSEVGKATGGLSESIARLMERLENSEGRNREWMERRPHEPPEQIFQGPRPKETPRQARIPLDGDAKSSVYPRNPYTPSDVRYDDAMKTREDDYTRKAKSSEETGRNWPVKPYGASTREGGGKPPEKTAGQNPIPRGDFPTFDGEPGSNPATWLKKCEDYFDDQCTIDDDAKVRQARGALTETAHEWYDSLRNLVDSHLTWREFKAVCMDRFGVTDTANPLGEISNLRHTGTVDDYCKAFTKLNNKHHELSNQLLMWLFCVGLTDELRREVEHQRPTSIFEAMKFARNTDFRIPYDKTRTFNGFYAPNSIRESSGIRGAAPTRLTGKRGASNTDNRTTENKGSEPKKPWKKKLTHAEMEERRKQGLCFNCDDQFTFGHVCKKVLFHTVLMPAGDTNVDPEDFFDEEIESAFISECAFVGRKTAQTFQVRTKVEDGSGWTLLDTGSSHNFIKKSFVEELGLPILKKPGLSVGLPNGGRLNIEGYCKNVPMTVQGVTFYVNCFVISLEGFDIILGMSWLNALGEVLWNGNDSTVAFNLEGRSVRWTSEADKKALDASLNHLDLAPDEDLEAWFDDAEVFITKPPIPPSAELQEHRAAKMELWTLANGGKDSDIGRLIEEFGDIFALPKGLPPRRDCDHRIRLITGTDPVAVRPYRYPHLQKDEIERQCAEMLKAGIIRRSTSPFSSPVLLVKKSDGSWRMCMDSRELNKVTVKDKFPIPVVDELLDELHGARYFTKLDLTAGYHQIRMHEDDIEKTAFRTHHGHFEFLVMPFGLSNAPSTFQGLMNSVFDDMLRKSVLVFFDDILVFSRTWDEHITHVRAVFARLRTHGLFLKKTKCAFGRTEVGYLGHVISHAGVRVDKTKVEAVTAWPPPTTTRGVRGFLGLSGYYRKFIRDYGVIAAPLTSLLRRNGFHWDGLASEAFDGLKKALSESPVLALPDFTEPFIVECDASGSGIGAVLQQRGHPVAFFSRKLADRHSKLAAYERELIGLAKAVIHWRPYLWGREFTIRTDHSSLKHLLEQRLTTPPQIHWVSKLLGYDFTVEYRAGSLNKVADALSRRDEPEEGGAKCSLHAFGVGSTSFTAKLRDEVSSVKALQELRDRVLAGEMADHWEIREGLIWYKKRAVLGETSPLIDDVIAGFHNLGHEGVQKTMERIRRDFYWRGWKKRVQEFVAKCQTCQKNKWEALQPGGLLQPLPIPHRVWADISMDFVEALPSSHGKNVIMVVVDRFSKYAHFIPLSHPFTATTVAKAFFGDIVRLHGFPESIVSDRDKVFRSKFWRELFRLAGTTLNFSTAYHPQSDGQTEVVNRTLEMYLRCTTGDNPKRWLEWLPWLEFVSNTSFHSATKTTPFHLVYGREPPRLLDYTAGSTIVEDLDVALTRRAVILSEARKRLVEAQRRMKEVYDGNHRLVEFKAGDWVWLKLHPYRQITASKAAYHKLSPRFYGPFSVVERVGSVAYRLKMPTGTRIHDVFHVSLLKAHKGEQPTDAGTLPKLFDGHTIPEKPAILLRARSRLGEREVLVQWDSNAPESATWEHAATLVEAFPELELEDKFIVEEGSNDTDPRFRYTYHRRKRTEATISG